MRVDVVFDDRFRPDTTGQYVFRELKRNGGHHLHPTKETSSIADALIYVDDGLEYPINLGNRLSIFWAIDTHIDFSRILRKAQQADLVFAAQRDGAEVLRAAGICSAQWLPLAAAPDIHAPDRARRMLDIAFVGNLASEERAYTLAELQRRYPKHFVGNAYFDEMAKKYSSAKIGFNQSIANDINMRFFEVPSCGPLLVTNDLEENGQEELLKRDQHIITYRSRDELWDKLDYYLKHDRIRKRIAAAGHAEVISRHTYRHRMEIVLKSVEAMLSNTSVCVPACLPPLEVGQHAATTSQLRASNDAYYYDFPRDDLLGRIPTTAQRILDIGCASGRLGEAVKRRQSAHVTGVEFQEHVAAGAKSRLDEVLVGDIESPEVDFPPGEFDSIVCGDVLEHLRDPLSALRKARRWLSDNGTLVISVPNIRNQSVLRMLLTGNWTYEAAGILDQTHLRFFTRREIEKLCYRADLAIEGTSIVPGAGYQSWVEAGRPGSLSLGSLQVHGLSSHDAEEFYAEQFVLVARPKTRQGYGLTSIVVVVHNELHYTRLCLDSLRMFTDEPYELIFVDNASTDGTAEFLAGVAGARVIRNEQNLGYPAAANQGMRAATGKQVLCLNNDIIVTTGWLRRQLDALHADDRVGLVGPCSNYTTPPQLVPGTYEDLRELDGFAWDWAKAHDREWLDTNGLKGFCLLIRREVIDRIGVFDERFGLGLFDDDDYCWRAREAGFRMVLAKDAYVHHFGSRTFRGSGVNTDQLLRENFDVFRAKWDADKPTENGAAIAAAPVLLPIPADQRAGGASAKEAELQRRSLDDVNPHRLRIAPGGGQLLPTAGPLVSLCMIVRDNASTIGAALAGIKPWVDEMIVVDTGSRDNTPQIARDLGAQVYEFPWCDDFSAARNESIRHAWGQWIFWMDSDDTIDELNGRKLRELLEGGLSPSVLGLVMQVHCPGPEVDGHRQMTVVDHVKVFRNLPELRFERRIHEQVLMPIRRVGGEVAMTDCFVVHSGYDHSPEGQARKRDRDLRLLEHELADRPQDTFTLFNLGMTYADGQEHGKAVDFLTRSIAYANPDESHLRKAYSLLVHSLRASGRSGPALQVCEEALRLFPGDAELHFRRGVLLHQERRHREAIDEFQTALNAKSDPQFRSVVQGIQGYQAHQNLAAVYTDLGDLSRAESAWRSVVAEEPWYPAGWRGLGTTLVAQGRLEDARKLAAELQQGQGALLREGLLLQADVCLREGAKDIAIQMLQQAAALPDSDHEALRRLCQLQFSVGSDEEMLQVLDRLVELAPDDPSVHHNLGTVHRRFDRPIMAAACYRRSLDLRPHSRETREGLASVLEVSGQDAAAVAEWQAILAECPNDLGAITALQRLSRG